MPCHATALNWTRVTAVVVGLGASAALLVGCAQDNSGDGQSEPRSALDSKQTDAEYQAEQAKFTLPPGSTWPAGDFQTDTSYGPGNGKIRAASVWLCDWEKVYVDAKSDPARDAALKELDKLKDTFMYRSAASPDVQKSYSDMLSKAALSDPSGISDDYTANCS